MEGDLDGTVRMNGMPVAIQSSVSWVAEITSCSPDGLREAGIISNFSVTSGTAGEFSIDPASVNGGFARVGAIGLGVPSTFLMTLEAACRQSEETHNCELNFRGRWTPTVVLDGTVYEAQIEGVFDLSQSVNSTVGTTVLPCVVGEAQPDLARPGDVIQDSGVAVTVPGVGLTRGAASYWRSGAQTLSVETLSDQVVIVYSCGPEDGQEGEDTVAAAQSDEPVPEDLPDPEPGGSLSSVAQPACSDETYNLKGFKWDSTYEWYFNEETSPQEIQLEPPYGAGQDRYVRARNAVREAASNITGVNTNCSLGDNVSAAHSYQGWTHRRAQITAPHKCTGTDGYNVVDFGDLGPGSAGAACWTFYSDPVDGVGSAIEVDIRFNKDDERWTTEGFPTCEDKELYVEAVGTHEFGHAFGLDHVGEGMHGNLTMSRAVNAYCGNTEATLGLGDILGLEERY